MMTILSAAYANAEDSAAVIQTIEAGAVLISDVDTPELWAQMFDGAVAAYAPPPIPAKICTPLEFIECFTGEEQLAVVAAAMQSAPLRLWYDKLMAAQDVVFDDLRLVDGMAALVDAGLITSARRDEILG